MGDYALIDDVVGRLASFETARRDDASGTLLPLSCPHPRRQPQVVKRPRQLKSSRSVSTHRVTIGTCKRWIAQRFGNYRRERVR